MEILVSIAAMAFVLFIPGYLWSYVFFKREVDAAERAALSFGLSIPLVTFTIFFLNRYFGVAINSLNSLSATAAICLMALGILLRNKVLAVQNLNLGVFFKDKIKISGEAAAVVAVLILAVYIAWIPHTNYDYPVHRDEWDRITRANAIINSGWDYGDPFLGEGIEVERLELGFNVWLATVKLASGEFFWRIFKYLSAFVPVFLALSSYVFARRFGYGLEAAFFVSLIPTTLNLLGPAFLIPVSLALPFIPLSLFLAFNARGGSWYLSLLFFMLFLLFAHPPTFAALSVLLFIFAMSQKKFGILIALALVSALALPYLLPYLHSRALVFTTFVKFSALYITLGYVPTILFVLGAFLVYWRGKADVVLVYGAIILLAINLMYRRLGWAFLVMPERNYLYLYVLMSIIAGYTLSMIGKRWMWLAALALVFVASHQHLSGLPYYHIIDGREFEDFQFIKDLNGEKAILDPWKAIAFTAIAEKKVYSRMPPYGSEFHAARNGKISEFFGKNCGDTAFLRENGISIVYSYVECKNRDLKQVRERVYVLQSS